MNKTIGVLAHVDAGKTTFCEQILYHTNSIRNRGRVDLKNTFLDNHEIERQRGITIFSEQGVFEYNNSNYYLVDTPGHIDFSADMERAISIMDYAVVVISSVEKIQSHTKTVFRLLKNNNIPIIFFANKIDREGSDIELLIQDIKDNLTNDIIDLSENLNIEKNKELSDELIEFIAERDDLLFEKYLNDEYENDLWINRLKEMVKTSNIYPLLKGSALHDIGIDECLQKIDFLTYTSYDENKEFIGKVYKVKYDENKNRITYIKALQGKLKVKDEVKYNHKDKILSEKINSIRVYNSNKYEAVNYIKAGQIFAVTGITQAISKEYICQIDYNLNDINKINNKNEIIPTLKSKVIFDKSLNIKNILNAFEIMDSEEPALNVVWDEYLKEIHIHVMGKIQLEILKDVIKNRFGIDIEFGKCEILYKETVKEKTIGYGHFEPLGHYAEVHLLIEPNKRDSSITFKNNAHVDDISIGHQNLIKTHLFEKEHKGVLCGYPLTDLSITLLTGRSHNKHTSGGDFRQATLRALRQGLDQVESILLEPYYKFRIEVDLNNMGRVLSDIQKMNGEFNPPETFKDKIIIEGRGPVATFMEYSLKLATFTKGNGTISLVFDGYDICHNSQEVIEQTGYNKDSDSEYTSNSIFCSKGQAYVVPSKDVKDHMHCLK